MVACRTSLSKLMLGYSNVISEEALAGLKKYKYSSVDKSPISKYILQPYWTYVATLFPIWMAPNLITTIGFVLVLANFTILMIYSPFLNVAGPNWIYFSFAIGLWFYSTLDNVDGKQARRTNSSSPLGELFDHGIDALNCTTGAMLQAGAMLTGPGFSLFILVGLTNIAFFFSTWETYYTGTLYLGEFNGPTEGLIISCITMLLSGFFGPEFWRTKIGETWNSPSEWINSMELQLFILGVFSILGLIFQVPPCIYRALVACNEKGISKLHALWNILPFFILSLTTTIWAFAPDSTVIQYDSFNTSILLLLAAGFACGRINAMIVLSHVTHTDYPKYNHLLIPFTIGSFITLLPQITGWRVFSINSERIFVILTLVYVVLDYTFWATKVVEQLTNHLKIKCFSISNSSNQNENEDVEVGTLS